MTLTGDACRRLEAIIRDDLEHATVSSAMVLVEEGGRIIRSRLDREARPLTSIHF